MSKLKIICTLKRGAVNPPEPLDAENQAKADEVDKRILAAPPRSPGWRERARLRKQSIDELSA